MTKNINRLNPVCFVSNILLFLRQKVTLLYFSSVRVIDVGPQISFNGGEGDKKSPIGECL